MSSSIKTVLDALETVNAATCEYLQTTGDEHAPAYINAVIKATDNRTLFAAVEKLTAFLAFYERFEGDALRDVAAERQRQIDVEGFRPRSDDAIDAGDLACGAACYAIRAADQLNPYTSSRSKENENPIFLWPLNVPFKTTTPRRDLVKAAALILAEIERIDRAEEEAIAAAAPE